MDLDMQIQSSDQNHVGIYSFIALPSTGADYKKIKV